MVKPVHGPDEANAEDEGIACQRTGPRLGPASGADGQQILQAKQSHCTQQCHGCTELHQHKPSEQQVPNGVCYDAQLQGLQCLMPMQP